MSATLLTAPGTLRVDGGKVYVTAHHPRQKAAKEYHVKPELLRAGGLPVAELDGLPAEVTWDLLQSGNMTKVEVQVPEDKPVVLRDTAGQFLNPYGFVSIPDRDELPDPLRDGEPAGHDRYRPELWSGTIAVTITTRTPMLIPDHARAAASDQSPPALPVRIDHLKRPMLSGSAVKGALRSAYEMITNSRFGVLGPHDQPLAIRTPADEKTTGALRPAWVSRVEGDRITLKVVDSLEPIGWSKEPDKAIQPAIWVPRSLACRKGPGCRSLGRCLKRGGRHCAERRGRIVEAWIYLAMLGKFPLWRVASYAEPGKLGAPPPRDWISGQLTKGLTREEFPLVKVRGRLHWTGSSFPAGGDKKHDERMVVEEVLDGGPARIRWCAEVEVDRELLTGWQAVIDSYDRAHENDRRRDSDYGGYVTDPEQWRVLGRNDTLYVELDARGKAVGLYPAMIGRKPFPGAPMVSLPEGHRPATDRDLLSPADRVFGWVRQGRTDDGVAHRGHLRVIPPDEAGTPGPGSVEQLGAPLPLVTLNSPKPSQFLFYLGDGAGKPLGGTSKETSQGYPAAAGPRRLRGRKVYLTQAEVLAGAQGADTYWTPPGHSAATPASSRAAEPIDVGGRPRYREYLRPTDGAGKGPNDEITTWVSSWVKAGTTFQMTLQVDNLKQTELGALLWLLDLPGDACLKLGLGKPLGFGAVRMEVGWDNSRFFAGDQLLDRYRTLGRSPAPTDPEVARSLAAVYDGLLRTHLPQVRTEFLNAARGFIGAPVHYPRAADKEKSISPDAPSKPRLTTYDWWVANDKVGNQDGKIYGRRLPLGELADPESLPLPTQPTAMRSVSQPGSSGGRHGRQGQTGGGRRRR